MVEVQTGEGIFNPCQFALPHSVKGCESCVSTFCTGKQPMEAQRFENLGTMNVTIYPYRHAYHLQKQAEPSSSGIWILQKLVKYNCPASRCLPVKGHLNDGGLLAKLVRLQKMAKAFKHAGTTEMPVASWQVMHWSAAGCQVPWGICLS